MGIGFVVSEVKPSECYTNQSSLGKMKYGEQGIKQTYRVL